MELILERIAKRKTYTIGRLYIRRQVIDEYLPGTEDLYFCDTLEPTWRDYANGAYKVKGRSAIPEGRYAVVISWSPSGFPSCSACPNSRASASMLATRRKTPKAAYSLARTAKSAKCSTAVSGFTVSSRKSSRPRVGVNPSGSPSVNSQFLFNCPDMTSLVSGLFQPYQKLE